MKKAHSGRHRAVMQESQVYLPQTCCVVLGTSLNFAFNPSFGKDDDSLLYHSIVLLVFQ